MKGENQLIDLTSEYILPGLAEGIIGLKKEEEKEIRTKLPDDYPKKEFAGKEVTLKVKLIAIKDRKLPNLDDDFAKDIGYSDYAGLRAEIKKSLEEDSAREAKNQLETDILDALLANNQIPALPESLVNSQIEYLKNVFEQRLKYQGIPKEFIEKESEKSKDKFKEEAQKQTKVMYILNSISEQEHIDVSKQDVEDRKAKLLQENPANKEYIDKQFSDQQSLNRLISGMKTDKIFEYVIKNSKIKTTEI